MNFTYGLEIELADVDRNTPLPAGCSWNALERDIVNSDGRAVDPSGELHAFGGEINTPPTKTLEEQVEISAAVFTALPVKAINYRTWLHTHVGLPEEVLNDVAALKKLQWYIQIYGPFVKLMTMGPSTRPSDMPAKTWAWYDEKFFPDYKYGWCQKATTVAEFRKAFFFNKNGSYAPVTFRRSIINLYSIFKHSTVEFRCFYGTMNPEEVRHCLTFSNQFVLEGLTEQRPPSVWYKNQNYRFPYRPRFIPALEAGWQKTHVEKHPKKASTDTTP